MFSIIIYIIIGAFAGGFIVYVLNIKKTRAREIIMAKIEQEMEISQTRNMKLENDITALNIKLNQTQQDKTILEQRDESRRVQYENNITTLNSIREQIEKDRKQEIDKRNAMEIVRLRMMKDNWARHQDSVTNQIKTICLSHSIEYLTDVPFKGKPDNTIIICGEFIIFDAKCPASDDLTSFNSYLKKESENAKKYVKEVNVRKEIFLVIPVNAIDSIEHTFYNLGDYIVYIIVPIALEPIILTLKRIEEYDTVDKLSPEERENICRIIGKFAHITKRRIQIDQYFSWNALEILTSCESTLPADMIDNVFEMERAMKLNPPQDRRTKSLSSRDDLKDAGVKIQADAEAKAVIFPLQMQDKIEELPLYKEVKYE